MRRLLLALPFALLPLAIAHAEEDHDHAHDHEHGSLGAHEHGVARLNAVVDDKTLELELESPAMNLVGFEHAASSDGDKARVAAARAHLEQPLGLFNLPKEAGCSVARQELESPLFGDKSAADDDHAEHSEIHAHYRFTCTAANNLKHLDLSQLFKAFPTTQKIQVQMIAPSGQQGVEATPGTAPLKF